MGPQMGQAKQATHQVAVVEIIHLLNDDGSAKGG